MDLIEAMEEEMERGELPPPPSATQRRSTPPPPVTASARTTNTAAVVTGTASWDFVLQQAAFVQTRLKALWVAKHRDHGDPSSSTSTDSSPHVPFSWVLSKLMRLIEEYPDGVTEAIVVTELMALLQRRVHSSSSLCSAVSSNRKVIRGVKDMTRVLSELEEQDDAILARLMSYDGHKLSIRSEKSSDVKLEMYLHQRFRACSAFLSSQTQYQSNSSEVFPFQRGRTVVFTNAKLMERRDVGGSSGTLQADDSSPSEYSLLPTQYLALHLDTASNAFDRVFAKQAIGLGRLDQFVGMQDPTILQQLVVRVKVLDIGAVRPSQTPLHIHRQVIFLGDATTTTKANGPSNSLSAISSTQRLAQASHVMILWDEQVALSQLFQIGDELAIFQPYVHVCDAQETEILRIFSEYSSQQRCAFYLEYGSATVFFVTPQSVAAASLGNSNTSEAAVRDRELKQFIESEQPPLKYEDVRHEWLNFSLYGHVKSIRVSHGIPLMAAYFYSYYDPKTNGSFQDSRSGTPIPALNRAIVSKFYLVVLLQIYNAVSQQTLAIEVTGENALKALRLQPGQTVLLDGLVAVDVRSPAIQKAREPGAHPTLTPQAAEATFAFQSADYTVDRSTSTTTTAPAAPSIVALCSDWGSIFGKQSMFSENARLTLVNATPGLLKTSLGQESKLVSSYIPTAVSTTTASRSRKSESSAVIVPMGMVLVQMCITFVGWLIPEDATPQITYSSDASCRKGFSTMCAHKACLRRLELAPTPNSHTLVAHHNGVGNGSADSHVPRWKCEFCHEIFSGMEETSQTFCSLVLRLDDGSTTMTQPLFAICHGETVEALLGLPAQDFSQLSLKAKFTILQQTIGKDYQVLLSRCEKLKVAITPSEQRHQHQLTGPAKQHLSRGPAAAGSPSRSALSEAMVAPVDLRVDLIEPLDVFAASHQLLQVLSRKA